MTIIVYRDGVMASDSLTTSSYGAVTGMSRKLFRAGDLIIGATGRSSTIQSFIKRIERGQQGEWDVGKEDDDFAAIVINYAGLQLYDCKGVPYTVDSLFHARGSAQDIAIGAMAMGATAEQAVEVCIQYNVYCGGPVQVERIGQ